MGESGLLVLGAAIVCDLVGSMAAGFKHAPTYKGFLWNFFLRPIG